MEVKDLLENWKAIATFVLVIGGGVYSVISWAEGEKAQIQAQQSLIHNEMYQENRIQRKKDTINDNLKMIAILESLGKLSDSQKQQLDLLIQENISLNKDIDEIRAKIAAK